MLRSLVLRVFRNLALGPRSLPPRTLSTAQKGRELPLPYITVGGRYGNKILDPGNKLEPVLLLPSATEQTLPLTDVDICEDPKKTEKGMGDSDRGGNCLN
jgi:hypothetical protein